ncbi:MAG: hypothetical protein M1822_003090 [Bathelium mastoideum]|nr:MAG: hypothetical protein M1822_003090 [Bathelium mastoideum]
MASRARSARVKKNKRPDITDPQHKTSIAKPSHAPGIRKSARLQNKPPVSYSRQIRPDQPSSTRPRPISQLTSRKQKHSQSFKVKADNTGDYSSASVASASYFTQETARSQRSSNTIAFYRYKQLTYANIYIHTYPPDNVVAAINRIIDIEPSNDRRAKIRNTAQELYKTCKEKVKAAAGEDDFVDLFHGAIKTLSPEDLSLHVKADWRTDLKPRVQHFNLNLSFLEDFTAKSSNQHHDLDDTTAPPPLKRQQQSPGRTDNPPKSSINTAPDSAPRNRLLQPDAIPFSGFRSDNIKTPRPDISMGIRKTALVSALSSALQSQNPDNVGVQRILDQLEGTMTLTEQGHSWEPALVSVPTQCASDLTFPFAVIEGKAYSTGKQVFEAQNQASISGASGLKIQLRLNTLVKRATAQSDIASISLENQIPLFFSICTEGPYHELWAHYTHLENDVCKFEMTLLKICHGVLLQGLEDFITAIDNVLRWGTGQFLQSVVDRLEKVARKATA